MPCGMTRVAPPLKPRVPLRTLCSALVVVVADLQLARTHCTLRRSPRNTRGRSFERPSSLAAVAATLLT
ncbi:unnamed protein product [Lampetra planeri]